MAEEDRYKFFAKPFLPASKLVKKTGKLVYTEDQLRERTDIIMSLFRQIFFDKQITEDHLNFKYKEYCRDVLTLRPDQVQHKLGNVKKALYKKGMTFSMFKELLAAVDIPIIKFSITTLEEDNERTYTSS